MEEHDVESEEVRRVVDLMITNSAGCARKPGPKGELFLIRHLQTPSSARLWCTLHNIPARHLHQIQFALRVRDRATEGKTVHDSPKVSDESLSAWVRASFISEGISDLLRTGYQYMTSSLRVCIESVDRGMGASESRFSLTSCRLSPSPGIPC